MKMQKYIFRLLFICSLLLSINNAFAENLDRIVAVVNDSVITQRQLDQQTILMKQQLQSANTPLPSEQELREKVLQHMIDAELQLQLAKKVGLQVGEANVDQAISDIAKRNGATVQQLKENVIKQGMSYDQYRKEIQRQIIISQVEQHEVGARVVVSEQEINDMLQHMPKQPQQQSSSSAATAYHIEDLLIPLSDKPTQQQITAASQKAKTILEKVRSGQAFSQLANDSQTDAKPLVNSDLGWRNASDLPTIFIAAIKNLQPGQTSDVIQAPNGFHILKIIAIKGAPAQSEQPMLASTHVRHILIKTTPLVNDAQARQRLLEIRADILRGGDFAKLAEKYSQDPGSAAKGGDLGWVPPGALAPQFEAAMNQLKPGQISEPVKTQFGWHLIEVLDRKKEAQTSQGYLREQARQLVFQRKFEEALQNWLRQLRATAYIKIMNN